MGRPWYVLYGAVGLHMLLAHICSEHDATPTTFTEQVGGRSSCVLGIGVGVRPWSGPTLEVAVIGLTTNVPERFELLKCVQLSVSVVYFPEYV